MIKVEASPTITIRRDFLQQIFTTLKKARSGLRKKQLTYEEREDCLFIINSGISQLQQFHLGD